MALNGDRTSAEWLSFITSLPGVPGQEEEAARELKKAFRTVADRVERDRMGSVYAWIEGVGVEPRPRALLAARYLSKPGHAQFDPRSASNLSAPEQARASPGRCGEGLGAVDPRGRRPEATLRNVDAATVISY